MPFDLLATWPTAPLTEQLVLGATKDGDEQRIRIMELKNRSSQKLIQWSSYDCIDHEKTHLNPDCVLSSSYIIRKALIRKHYLHRCTHAFISKNPRSVLSYSVPQTWDLELSFADELDEMWSDELWDLGKSMQESFNSKWWILKPGMADRGNNIRLFDSKESLQEIFESYDDKDPDDASSSENDEDEGVFVSQLRHFVIQEYLTNPVLFDPSQIPLEATTSPRDSLNGFKFHLRVYCVAVGALSVYFYPRILALFSSERYSNPSKDTTQDLAAHLTNTSLQQFRGEEGVRLFSELVGCKVLSGNLKDNAFTQSDADAILSQVGNILSEVFQAAVQQPVHYQPLPNAFELYGVDFLLTHGNSLSPSPGGRFQVNLLEFNAEPAIELTGPRLKWILEDLFSAINEVCVQPFVNSHEFPGHSPNLRKCFEVHLR